MSKEFKVGDFVYYPNENTQVFRLEVCSDSEIFKDFPFAIEFYDDNDNEFSYHTFTIKGLANINDELPLLFHATPENKAKLEALYGVEFEKPPIMALPE